MAKARDEAERTYGQWWDFDEAFVEASVEAVRRLCVAALQDAGASAEDATFIAEARLAKALQGDHTRGLRHFPNLVRSAKRGEIDLRPQIRVLRETPATALIDGGPKAPSL